MEIRGVCDLFHDGGDVFERQAVVDHQEINGLILCLAGREGFVPTLCIMCRQGFYSPLMELFFKQSTGFTRSPEK